MTRPDQVSGQNADDQKAVLHRYLRDAREALLWKLDGLGEYDVRRPLTPTGTNLLGLVKHVAYGALGYFGDVFGRPSGEPSPWSGGDLMADMWAAAGESREQVTGLYQRAWAHADATIGALPLDAAGQVPWWPPERRDVTLQRVMVHMLADLNRHAGHADIVRELIDGSAGLLPGSGSLPDGDAAWWEAYRGRLEEVAREAAGS